MSRLERNMGLGNDPNAFVSSDWIITRELSREINRRKEYMSASDLNDFVDKVLESDPHIQVRVADYDAFVKSLPWVTASKPAPEVENKKAYAREDLLPFNQHNPNAYAPDMWD